MLCLTLVVGAAVAGCGSPAPNAVDSPQEASRRFAGSIRPPSIPATDFKLSDQGGHSVTAKSLRGNAVIVAFLYATCTDTCPLIASQIRGALNRLDATNTPVKAIAISVDPTGDTESARVRFLRKQNLAGRLHFLSGTRHQLAPIWRQFGVAPQRDQSEHTALVVIIDRTGKQRSGFPADKLTPEALADDVRTVSQLPR